MPHDKLGRAIGPGDVVFGRAAGNETGPEYLGVVTQIYPGTDTCNATIDVIARRLTREGGFAPCAFSDTVTLGEMTKLDL